MKKGERVGLVGWNGAGKTTQLKIITGEIEPDKGEVIRVKNNMNIAYLTQEFELVMTRTVREEFLSAFGDSLKIMQRLEEAQKELEKATDDMDRMVRSQPLNSLITLRRSCPAGSAVIPQPCGLKAACPAARYPPPALLRLLSRTSRSNLPSKLQRP